jgi:hypothetical protein
MVAEISQPMDRSQIDVFLRHYGRVLVSEDANKTCLDTDDVEVRCTHTKDLHREVPFADLTTTDLPQCFEKTFGFVAHETVVIMVLC